MSNWAEFVKESGKTDASKAGSLVVERYFKVWGGVAYETIASAPGSISDGGNPQKFLPDYDSPHPGLPALTLRRYDIQAVGADATGQIFSVTGKYEKDIFGEAGDFQLTTVPIPYVELKAMKDDGQAQPKFVWVGGEKDTDITMIKRIKEVRVKTLSASDIDSFALKNNSLHQLNFGGGNRIYLFTVGGFQRQEDDGWYHLNYTWLSDPGNCHLLSTPTKNVPFQADDVFGQVPPFGITKWNRPPFCEVDYVLPPDQDATKLGTWRFYSKYLANFNGWVNLPGLLA